MFTNNEARTHDAIYLHEDRKDTPKEYFKFLAAHNKIADREAGFEIMDIGCATGEFIYYLNSINSSLSYTGLDVNEPLLDVAKRNCPFSSFITKNIMTITNTDTERKYDLIFASGVMSIFDNYEMFIDNTISLAKDRSIINIFGIFNPENIDVIIKSRHSLPLSDQTPWEKGWNVFSIESIKSYVNKNYKEFSFHAIPWNIEIDIPKNSHDPYRAYTVNLENNKKIQINGLQLVQTMYLLQLIR